MIHTLVAAELFHQVYAPRATTSLHVYPYFPFSPHSPFSINEVCTLGCPVNEIILILTISCKEGNHEMRNVVTVDSFWKSQTLRNMTTSQHWITHLTQRVFSKIRDTPISCHNFPWSPSPETWNKVTSVSEIVVWDTLVGHEVAAFDECRFPLTHWRGTYVAWVVGKGGVKGTEINSNFILT